MAITSPCGRILPNTVQLDLHLDVPKLDSTRDPWSKSNTPMRRRDCVFLSRVRGVMEWETLG